MLLSTLFHERKSDNFDRSVDDAVARSHLVFAQENFGRRTKERRKPSTVLRSIFVNFFIHKFLIKVSFTHIMGIAQKAICFSELNLFHKLSSCFAFLCLLILLLMECKYVRLDFIFSIPTLKEWIL